MLNKKKSVSLGEYYLLLFVNMIIDNYNVTGISNKL